MTFSLSPNITTFSDTGLVASTAYHYRVKAVNGTVSSAYSATASATTPAAAPVSYASTIQADGPVLFCRLGERSGTAIADQTGGPSGTYGNNPTLGAPSLLPTDAADAAVSFGGVNQFGRINGRAALRFGSAFTIEVWIKPDALPAPGAGHRGDQGRGLLAAVQRAEAGVHGHAERTRRRLQAPAGAVVAGTGYHVVATYDGTRQRLYLNGSEVANVALSGAASSTTTPVMIGAWDGASEFFKGTIDEVAVYNKVLSAVQVSGHRAAGTR